MQDTIDAAWLCAFNGNELYRESQWLRDNSALQSTLEKQRGYAGVQFTTFDIGVEGFNGGRCQALRISEPHSEFLRNFEGGADDLRRVEASMMAVCQGYGPQPQSNASSICEGRFEFECEARDGDEGGLSTEQIACIVAAGGVLCCASDVRGLLCIGTERQRRRKWGAHPFDANRKLLWRAPMSVLCALGCALFSWTHRGHPTWLMWLLS